MLNRRQHRNEEAGTEGCVSPDDLLRNRSRIATRSCFTEFEGLTYKKPAHRLGISLSDAK
jgi:hypothetical protein